MLFTTRTLGIVYAVAGFHHGVFEVLQGNAPTPGFFIDSIGPEHVRWEFGADGAMTVLPTFLATGLAATGVSVVIVAWLIGGLKGRLGTTVAFLLFCLLALTGGGIGFIPFFLSACAWDGYLRGRAARRERFRCWSPTGRLWLPALIVSAGLFLIVLELSVFGLPGGDVDGAALLTAITVLLLISFVTLHLAYVAAASRL
ncbi:MAG: hypothetical protein ACU0DK_06930 [Pseudooceanicola sp.]